jgi:hypothetical protein
MWQIGRSANPKSPYFKWPLFVRVLGKLLKADAYILKYPEGSAIDFHKDSAPVGYKHYRLNIVLKRAKVGGEFIIKQVCPDYGYWINPQYGRIHLFRPDITEHAVSPIAKGTRYVLSIGWLVKE